MKKPEFPEDEAQRIQALESLDILDSPAEERFDRYTRLAKRLFGVPIALVSLVDSNRQWFKSRQGLEASETPRDISFCGHAILDSEVFVVENAAQDERFSDNPLVMNDPNIRFYAGFPLPGPRGHRLGTLCIIDREPRKFSADDLEALEDIGAMVASELAALQLATSDELTGISNRRGFEKLARHALATCRRTEQTASLVFIDMDGFKEINDEHGHEEGDRALIEFSDMLLHTLRDSDVVARLGGDEFCALLTGTDEELANNAVGRLREAVWQRNRCRKSRYPLGFSAGVAEYDPRGHGCVEELLREADSRMYRDKRTRSDRCREPSAA